VNTPKSIYLPGEEVKIIVGVLNSQGKRAYDANVTLIVRSPSGKTKVFNSYNGDFAADELDGSIFVLYNETSETGRYNISVVSVESDVVTTYETFFEVREFVEFDIERKMKTLIDVGHPNTNLIKIKSNVNARNITIIEKIPNEFLEVVVYNGRIERRENETWLIWNIPYLSYGEEKTLKYEFTTPDVKPAIYLAGPISVFYNNSLEFNEVRYWTFIVVDVVYYFFKLMPYYKTDVLQYPVDAVHHLVYNSYEVYRDAIVMCRNNFNYTLRWVLFDEADDDAGVLQDWELQVATPTWQPITSTGINGWRLYPGETNPHTSVSGIGQSDTCTRNPGTANGDKCEWDGGFVWNITITPSAPLGLNKIRLLPKTRTTGPIFDTNIIHTYLIDCAYPYDVNLIRPIKIFSPAGEPIDRVVRGHIARIVVPLANYNTSFDKTVNVSIKILNAQTNEEQKWYVINGSNRQVTIPKTLSPPNWNFSVVTFTVLVPDDIQTTTYKIIVNISSQSSSITHEKSFDVYTDDSGVTSDIALFVATPRKQGANCENQAGTTCASGPTTNCAGANYCFRDWRLIYVCNYGDYNLTVNVTDQTTGAHQYYTTESTAAYPQPDFNDTTTGSVLKWYNVKLNTSTCFKAAIPYRPTDDTGEENYYLTAEWQDPVTGGLKSVTKQFTALISASTGTKNPTIAAELNVTSAFPNQQLPLRIITKFGGTDLAGGAGPIVEGTRGALIHYIEIFITPGFSKPTSFKIIDANGAAVRTVNPEPGYPLGSEDEGWIVKFSPYTALGTVPGFASSGTVMRVGADTSPQAPNDLNYIEFLTNVSSEDKIIAGGKTFLTNFIGWGRINKDYIFHLDSAVLSINAPFIKTVRYYNTSSTNEQEGFPSSFACGAFNTKLQVFNKGNLPLLNSNVTENKQNISVTHPSDLQFSNFVPPASFYNSTFINWDGGISFTFTGKDNSKNYSYLISVPYQTNGTFRFQSIPTNKTFRFLDEPYDIFVACGASLTVSQPSFSPSNPFVNQHFNASSIITNFGPGNASNVIAVINYTGPGVLEIRNSTGDLSNVTYLGTIELNGNREAKWNITANTAGTYTICIRANATENSTKVMSCNNVLVSLPPATIEMENTLAISKETGTSSGSWGFNFTFNVSVRVTNSENDVQVCSYFSKTGSEPFRLVGCDVYPAPGSGNTGDWRNFTFEFDAGCEDIGSPVFVKFNATNNAGTTNSTSTTFAITKDIIFFEDIIGNGTETRRGKTTTLLALRVRDKNNTLITNLPVTFYVTLDGSIFDSGTTNSTNESAYANYYFQAKCSPKYQVGYQKWKAVVSGHACYFDNSTENFVNLSVLVTGDIILSLQKPDGTTNFTQEQKVPFLGATTDDCNDPLTTNVRFFANKSSQSFECSPVSQVGANAYTCDWQTNILTPMGWYNASMFANKTFHYDNSTANLGYPGLFFLNPIKKLENPSAFPTTEGWGYPNWNFSVIASSGDSENV
jgi:hypothetical protein